MNFRQTLETYFPSADRIEVHAGKGRAEILPIREAVEKYGEWTVETAAASTGTWPRAWLREPRKERRGSE